MQNTANAPFGMITYRPVNSYMTRPFGKNIKETSFGFLEFMAELDLILNTERNTEIYEGDIESITLAGGEENITETDSVQEDAGAEEDEIQ